MSSVEMETPRDFDGLRSTMIGMRDVLPKRLAQVAEYALREPDEIAFGTAASIAEAAGVQPSTLVRFARQFGYSGFTDMQTVFRARLKDRNASYEERIAALHGDIGASPDSKILSGFFEAAGQSVAHLAGNLDTGAFSDAVKLLAGAETIYLIARRRAFPLAAYMAYAFGKMGIRVQLTGSAPGIDEEIISCCLPSDAGIAISFSPYAPESVHLTERAAAAGLPLVAITDSALSPLTRHARHCLEVVEDDFAGFRSLSASMALCMALTVAVADARKIAAE